MLIFCTINRSAMMSHFATQVIVACTWKLPWQLWITTSILSPKPSPRKSLKNKQQLTNLKIHVNIGTKSKQDDISVWIAKIIWQPWRQSDSCNLYFNSIQKSFVPISQQYKLSRGEICVANFIPLANGARQGKYLLAKIIFDTIYVTDKFASGKAVAAMSRISS